MFYNTGPIAVCFPKQSSLFYNGGWLHALNIDDIRHYDNTYKDFTYNINKYDIT